MTAVNMILFDPDDLVGVQAAALLVVHHYAMTEGRAYNDKCYCGHCETEGRLRGEALVAISGSMEEATKRMFGYLNTIALLPIRVGDWEAAERIVGSWLEAHTTILMEAAPVAGHA